MHLEGAILVGHDAIHGIADTVVAKIEDPRGHVAHFDVSEIQRELRGGLEEREAMHSLGGLHDLSLLLRGEHESVGLLHPRSSLFEQCYLRSDGVASTAQRSVAVAGGTERVPIQREAAHRQGEVGQRYLHFSLCRHDADLGTDAKHFVSI